MTETRETTVRGRMPRDVRRAQLLAAAQDVFVVNGYHATGMDDIAERAGVSKPVLYQHFPGKLELYLALVESHVDALIARIRAALASTTDNKARVRATVGAYFDFVHDEGSAYQLVFESDLRGEPVVQAAISRSTNACVNEITEKITADAGLDPERARLLAVGLVGMSEVTARSWIASNRTVNKSEAVTLISTLAWRGIGAGFPLQH
ncbi:TetR/AcrR family transcriptional regulator [Sciscionella sediminilitoris]|uniref:TetR/AcrR family transcriptional regulator n=1 Tax=Sciscionella sediminilitoris TaxID=1445613 RepID=UPI0004DEEDB3|nr:TetR/AcrR family transcriptional regulator [Sciscionella sp. SE31]